jgi:hypothetical protein
MREVLEANRAEAVTGAIFNLNVDQPPSGKISRH